MQAHLVLNAPSPSVASFDLSIKLLSQFGFFCENVPGSLECWKEILMSFFPMTLSSHSF